MGELYLRKVIVDIIPSIGSGLQIKDLRIQFKVEKTNESTPNTAEIRIYNLSESTRALFEAEKSKVRLSIGYLGLNPDGKRGFGLDKSSNVQTVVIGDITRAAHKKKKVTKAVGQNDHITRSKVEGVDLVTTVEVADGDNRYRNSRLDKGYPPNVRLKDVFTDLATSMGLGTGVTIGVPEKNYANGLSLSGLSRDHLNVLTRSNNLEWSIQDETLQIIPQGVGTSDAPILISPETGLVGSPTKTTNGVEFDSLIQPALRPGRRVQIESRLVKGIFKLRKVTHEGDSQRGDFLSKCEATA